MESPSKETGLIAAPPYVSAKTLLNFLERLKQGLPTHIDRSLMNGYSGAVMSQLTLALRFLNLIGNNNETTELLEELVMADNENRPKLIEKMLWDAYPFFKEKGFDLATATTGTLDQQFREMGVSGDTLRKCSSFLVSFAKAAGWSVSPHIKTGGRVSTGARPATRKGRKTKLKADDGGGSVTPPYAPPGLPTIHAAILGYIQGLPKENEPWTQDALEQWLEGMKFTLAMVYKVTLVPRATP